MKTEPLNVTAREKQLLRRFAAGLADEHIATDLGDTPSRIAAQRQRFEKFQIRTPEQLTDVAEELARHSLWKARSSARRHVRRSKVEL